MLYELLQEILAPVGDEAFKTGRLPQLPGEDYLSLQPSCVTWGKSMCSVIWGKDTHGQMTDILIASHAPALQPCAYTGSSGA